MWKEQPISSTVLLARHRAAAMVFTILPDGCHSGQLPCQSTLGTAVQAFSSPIRHAIFGHALDEGDVKGSGFFGILP